MMLLTHIFALSSHLVIGKLLAQSVIELRPPPPPLLALHGVHHSTAILTPLCAACCLLSGVTGLHQSCLMCFRCRMLTVPYVYRSLGTS